MPSGCASSSSGEGEGAAAQARLTGIKAADVDSNVLTVEYLSALERIGDGRATKLVIPVEFSGLLGTVSALAETVRGPTTTSSGRVVACRCPTRPNASRCRRRAMVSDEGGRRSSRRVVPGSDRAAPGCAGGTASDWTDDLPPATDRRASWHEPRSRRSRSPSGRRPSTRSKGQLSRTEMETVVTEVRQVARREVDRAADIFAQRASAAAKQFQPLVTEYTTRLLRWLKVLAIVAVIALVGWIVFHAVAEVTLFEWLGDRIDALTD